MFVCNAGIGCQGRVGDACREEDLDAFIQDALDAIDYALGDGTTEWSRKRVENGHPEPFPLQYVEIGNENWGPVYEKRYDRFYRAIKAKYPRLTLISTLGLGGQHRHERVDMIDPHWYVAPEFSYLRVVFSTSRREAAMPSMWESMRSINRSEEATCWERWPKRPSCPAWSAIRIW